MALDETTREWIATLDMHPVADDWAIQMTLSTVPMSHWFYKRNKLRPEDVRLELVAPGWGHWRVELERHDRQYLAQWRTAGDFRVVAKQLRYRKLVQWPSLPDIGAFPALVAQIEAALNIQFIRHVNVEARDIPLAPKRFDDQKLCEWLAPCADSWGRTMRDAGEDSENN
jgi:hypothetical protein